MRRFILLLLAVAVLGGFPLYLYLRTPSPTGPSKRTEEVMVLAAQKSRALQSARLTGDGRFRLEGGALPASGTVTVNGVLQDAGDSVQMSVTVDALATPGGNKSQTFRLQGTVDMIVAGKQELYFRIQSLSTEPDDSLFQPELVALLSGRWWALPSPASGQEGAAPGGSMTPSPSVLRAQAQVVKVTADRGTETLDGAAVYHYDVAIDPDRLIAYLEEVAAARKETLDRSSLASTIAGVQATGEMWIDAQTYVLKKVTWQISALKTEQGILSGTFTVELGDFDSAPTIAPPADAKPFSPASFFGIDPAQNVPGGTLTPEQIQQYRSLIEGASVPTE
ncbi:MAG: hypothetical protein PHX87_03455 [Candidatus Peribacteraceae bacterium]|nr:hypothetical protein [Candidatus Peribacteraceae bacterium]MDD5742463.1 hypothetical protein [Candidatus Peribacteraceae bacterium]